MWIVLAARSLCQAILLAIAFLTIVPIRFGAEAVSDAELARSRFAYPWVGGLIGLTLAALSVGLARIGATREISAFVLVASAAIVTGGLHLDGLADTADGLFLTGDRTRRLDVMRDPRVGSFGLTAVVLVMLGKYAALSSMGGHVRGLAVLIAMTVSRSLVLVSSGTAAYARPQGTGRIVIEATTLRDAIGAALLVLVMATATAGRAGLAAGAIALVWSWGLTRLVRARLGGVTGDTLGALVETSELVVLIVLGLLQKGS